MLQELKTTCHPSSVRIFEFVDLYLLPNDKDFLNKYVLNKTADYPKGNENVNTKLLTDVRNDKGRDAVQKSFQLFQLCYS